jgi:hypothetical protein
MPDPSANEELALLDAFGELDSEQAAQLRIALEADSALAERHARLCEMARGISQTLAPIRTSESAPVVDVVPPAHILAWIEDERRALVSERSHQPPFPPPENIVKLDEPGPWDWRPAPRTPWQRFHSVLAIAATVLLLAGVAAIWLVPLLHKTQVFAVALSPRGNTGVTRPLLVWDNASEQKYDVWILPSEGKVETTPALFVAKGVQSPVAFSELKPGPAAGGSKDSLEPGQAYRVLVCLADTGRLGGVAQPFQVAAKAVDSLPQPTDAAAALGEALMLIVQLPPAERNRPEIQAAERELRRQISRLGTLPSTSSP